MRSYLVVKPLARVCEADVRALDAQLQMGGFGPSVGGFGATVTEASEAEQRGSFAVNGGSA